MRYDNRAHTLKSPNTHVGNYTFYCVNIEH